MKKRIMALVLAVCAAGLMLCGCRDTGSGLTKVRLNEVAHSIFYAPMYVAIEDGYFEEEDYIVEWPKGSTSWMDLWACGEESLELVE